jgi:hypothetical protein
MRTFTHALLALGASLVVAMALAQPAADAGGPAWRTLTPAQRSVLAPLEQDWATIEPTHKQKWLDLAVRFPNMPVQERARVQERMANWARLSPQERGQARLQFQEARQLSPEERQARWQAYQALPPQQKQELAQRAKPTPAPKARAADNHAEPKSNLVPNPVHGAPARAVAPTVVQAAPGATTTLVTKPGAPPRHQQTGLPKIAATPGFVDSTTLLPKRGPQGAATSGAPPSEPARRK